MAATKTDNRRPEIERMLREQYRVEFTYREGVDISEFDLDKSLDNQARDVPLNDDLLAGYTEAAKAGDRFPPLIAHRPGRAKMRKLVLIDGNHRLHAQLGTERQKVDVYEIKDGTKSQTIDVLTSTVNARNGQPPTDAEKVRHAIRFIENGSTVEHAARMMQIAPHKVTTAWKRQKADRKARDAEGLDIRGWESLPYNVRAEAAKLPTEDTFVPVATLAFQARMGAPEVAEVVNDVLSAKTNQKQQAIIRQVTKELRPRIQSSGGGVLSTPSRRKSGETGSKQRIGAMLKAFRTLPDDVPASVAALYTQNERDELVDEVEDLGDFLTRVAKEMRA